MGVGFSQDIHFSQSAQTPLFINPAAAGVFDGWERVIINHRNQWLGAGTQFMTTALAADVNLFKPKVGNKAYLGVGFMFFNDVGGDSKFGNQSAQISLSGILPAGNGSNISVGIQGGYGSKKVNLSNVYFMSQWDMSKEAFNPMYNSGEYNGLTSYRYLDVSSGVMYQYDGSQNNFSRKSNFKFQLGAAAFHLNNPELAFANGLGDRLHRKFVGHMSFSKDLSGRPLAIDGSAVFVTQGGHQEIILGGMVKYRFENGTKITGLSQDSYFGFGVYHRWKDAITPAITIDWRSFHFGVSYDVTISKLARAYKGGSLEFSLAYVNKSHSIFKTRKRKF